MRTPDLVIAGTSTHRPVPARQARLSMPFFGALSPLHLAGFAVAGLVLLPIVYLGIRTFTGDTDAADLIFRARTGSILLRSLLLAVIVTVGSAAIAVPLAWLTLRSDLPLRRFWSVAAVLPLVIPSFVGGFIAVAALGPKGTLQGLLERLFGIESIPDIFGLPGASLVLILLTYPYVFIPVRAALRRTDVSMEEAARSLGRGAVATFFTVTLPLLRPAVTAGALLTALYTLSDFGAVSLLRYETFTWAIFLQFESAFDRALASSLSLILVLVVLVILAVDFAYQGRGRYHRTSAGGSGGGSIVRLGGWQWPALGFAGAVVGLGLFAPVGMLIYWLAVGMGSGEALDVEISSIWNSLQASALAAGAGILAALPVAILAVRRRGVVTSAVERVVYLGFGLPGVVVALGLVFFGVNVLHPVYQTRVLLVAGYVVLFVPGAMGAIRASLLQVNPRAEEAARGLGKHPAVVFYRVTLPLILPGILAGAAMIFLLTMKELPATLILGPIGFETLATSVWSYASEGFFAKAALPALILVAGSGIPTAFLLLRDRRMSSAADRDAAGPVGSVELIP